jgi:hypothetical protein
MKALIVAALVAAVVCVFASAAGASSASGRITVVSPSVCFFDGIDDVYTGDGHVGFVFTLRNSGAASKVNVTPVRHYSDGGYNASAMDMLLDVTVPAHSTKRVKSPIYTYKAHQHAIVGCGAEINGGREVRISAKHV